MTFKKILEALSQDPQLKPEPLTENEAKAYAFANEGYKFYIAQGYGEAEDINNSEGQAKFQEFFSRYKQAYEFYEKEGFPPRAIASHLSGIDFTQPVEEVVLKKDTLLTQFQAAWGTQGNYYSTSDHSPTKIGIAAEGKPFRHPKERTFSSPEDKEAYDANFPALPPSAQPQTSEVVIKPKLTTTYKATEDVNALKSTARAIVDTWSSNQSIQTEGGGTQYFCMKRAVIAKYDLGANDRNQQKLPLFEEREIGFPYPRR